MTKTRAWPGSERGKLIGPVISTAESGLQDSIGSPWRPRPIPESLHRARGESAAGKLVFPKIPNNV